MGIIGGDQFNAQLGTDAGNPGVNDAVFYAAMVLDLEVEVVAKSMFIPAGNLSRRIEPAMQNRLRNFASQAGSSHDQTFAVLAQQLLVDTGTGKDAPAAHAA